MLVIPALEIRSSSLASAIEKVGNQPVIDNLSQTNKNPGAVGEGNVCE